MIGWWSTYILLDGVRSFFLYFLVFGIFGIFGVCMVRLCVEKKAAFPLCNLVCRMIYDT